MIGRKYTIRCFHSRGYIASRNDSNTTDKYVLLFSDGGYADIKTGKIDCIVVKDLSRFGRNYRETGNYLERIFPFFCKYHDVELKVQNHRNKGIWRYWIPSDAFFFFMGVVVQVGEAFVYEPPKGKIKMYWSHYFH